MSGKVDKNNKPKLDPIMAAKMQQIAPFLQQMGINLADTFDMGALGQKTDPYAKDAKGEKSGKGGKAKTAKSGKSGKGGKGGLPRRARRD